MNHSIWKFIIILLSFSIQRCPLLLADCQIIKELGYLTVEPGPVFLIGSNLTVHCHTHKCQPGFTISLELNGEPVKSKKECNCTTVMFHLLSVRIPQSILVCKLKGDQSKIVSGKDLRVPPDKPENIVCETTKSSDFIDCSWKNGQETHLSTTYNISVNRANGTQVHLYQVQDGEEMTIPRRILDKNTKYQLIITAYNQFGSSQSDPFSLSVKNVVVPETPHIIDIEFGNTATAATLHWKTAESSLHLKPYLRLRTRNSSWEVREGSELRDCLIGVHGLRPLTEYEFQVRTCNSQSGLTHASTASSTLRSTSGERSLCSRWSPSVMERSPGKGPSQQLHVWRMLNSFQTKGLQNWTILWKPPPPEDYSGMVQQYKIFLDNDLIQEVVCPATSSQYSLLIPAEVQALSVSAVTLYGSSPPADAPLRHSGVFGLALRELALAANGSVVLVSWSWPRTIHRSTAGEELLHYVVEWITVPATQLQWQKLDKYQNSTSITGLTAGVRYNISVYAVTTRGVSAPLSGLIYSKEQKPASGPHMSVLDHEAKRILILWDELPVDQRRGFITSYTLYFQKQDSSKAAEQQNVTLSGSGPRQVWLDCPEGALALQMTASTAAGEGPWGTRVSSQPAETAVGLVIVTIFILMLFIVIIANLMCWSCVRRRVKQKCISWGPGWLIESIPKPENSNAIRLLEQVGGELSFSSTHGDPPISSICLISSEKEEMYPIIHVKVSQTGSGQPATEHHDRPLLLSDAGTVLVDRDLGHVSYKPHIATFASQGEEVNETEEEQRDIPASGEGEVCSSAFGGLLGGLLPSVEVDFSDSPVGLTLSPAAGLLTPKTPDTSRFLTEDSVLGDRGPDSPSLELQKDDSLTTDMTDTHWSQFTVESSLIGDYFPQIAAVNSDPLCETQGSL